MRQDGMFERINSRVDFDLNRHEYTNLKEGELCDTYVGMQKT